MQFTYKHVAKLINRSPKYTRVLLHRRKISMYDIEKVFNLIREYDNKLKRNSGIEDGGGGR